MNREMNRLGFVCGAMLLTCLICVCAQFAIMPSYDNVLSSVLAGIGICCMSLYLWLSRPFDDTPLSSLALLGFCVSSEFAALVSQTTQGQEFVYFLRDPVRTFAMLTSAQCVAIAVHYAYRKFQPLYGLRDWVGRTLLSPLGVHDVPKPLALWLLSAPGIISMLQGGAALGDASGKLLQAMEFMVWMPFLILVYKRQFGSAYSDSSTHLIWVAIYAALIMAVAIGRNARGMMFIGPVSLALLYLMVSVREKGPMSARSLTRVIVAMSLVGFAVVIFADVATGMAIVRSKRDDVKNWDLVKETYVTILDRAKIEAYREDGFLEGRMANFEEIYISNPILNRFSETKFHDNMIFFSQGMNEVDRDRVIEENLKKVVTLLPQPILDFLGLKIKKADYFYSMGDVYVNAVVGMGMGGYITGSIWADCLVIFGDFWPFVIALMLLVVYMQIDSFARLDKGFFISPIGMCMAWTFFLYGIGGESFAVKAAMLLRDMPQKLLLFVMLLLPIRMFAPSLFFRAR